MSAAIQSNLIYARVTHALSFILALMVVSVAINAVVAIEKTSGGTVQ